MKLKRLNKIKINCYEFEVEWVGDKDVGGSFDYDCGKIRISTHNRSEEELFMILCHEIIPICFFVVPLPPTHDNYKNNP